MSKYTYTKEYDFRASARILYPYISTVQGLSEWFVDKVWIDNDNVYHFEWQGEPLKAVMKMHKINTFVKFEFSPKVTDTAKEPLNFVELKLELDELTGLTYLKVTDFSEINDELQLTEMWHNFISTLKEKVGG